MAPTPLFVHALKKLPDWVIPLQEAFQYNFTHCLALDKGEKDLFCWCNDLIGLATSRVMLGSDKDIDVAAKWLRLVQSCNIEMALSGQGMLNAARSLVEVALTGERPIYRKTRSFLYPYIEQEIDILFAEDDHDSKSPAATKPGSSVIFSLVQGIAKQLNNDPELVRQAKVRIANDLIFFTFAAMTNTFGAAAWTLYHVIRNTEGCGDKIRTELQRQNTTDDDTSSKHSAPVVSETLEHTIPEVTRLYRPATVFRLVEKPFTLSSSGHVIPVGAIIGVNIALVERQQKYPGNDSCRFDPSRFAKEQQPTSNTKKHFYGFGFGCHPCVGRRFAITEISMFVAAALETFDFELVFGDDQHSDTQSPTNPAKAAEAKALTKRMISNVSSHPILNPAQASTIWRPMHPVMVKYQRKQQEQKAK